jgi:hypothetical protein
MFTSCQAAIILQVHVTFNYIDENGENQMHMVEQPSLVVDDQTFYMSNHSDN